MLGNLTIETQKPEKGVLQRIQGGGGRRKKKDSNQKRKEKRKGKSKAEN